MGPDELRNNFEAAVLYYCFDRGDTTIHSRILTDLGGISWDGGDKSMDQKTWTQEYGCPDNETLMGFELQPVLDYWNSKYVWPTAIKGTFASAFYHIDDESLSMISLDESYIGVMIFNTSRRQVQYCDGLSWLRLI